MPILFVLLLVLLFESAMFDFLVMLLNLPTFFLPRLLPNFGVVGIGDVTGFVYLSEALNGAIYYFLFGMLLGYIIYRINNLHK